MEEDADWNAIAGESSPSDYDTLTGGSYSSQQDPWTAIDNGTLNNGTTGTGTASSQGTVAPPSNGASYTPPSWLSTLTNAGSSLAGAAKSYTTTSPVTGGQPAASPAQAGLTTNSNAAASTIAGIPTTTWLIISAAATGLFFLMRKK